MAIKPIRKKERKRPHQEPEETADLHRKDQRGEHDRVSTPPIPRPQPRIRGQHQFDSPRRLREAQTAAESKIANPDNNPSARRIERTPPTVKSDKENRHICDGEERERNIETRNKIEKKPLIRDLNPAIPFPIEALGELQNICRVLRELTVAPLEICAQTLLAAVTLAVQPFANVEIDGRERSINLFFLTIGSSGARKTATEDLAMKPFRDHEEELRIAYDRDMTAYEWDLHEFKEVKKEAIKEADPELRSKTLRELGDPPQAPLLPVIITGDATMEGLTKLFIAGQPSIGLFSGEGGRMLGGYGMSRENQLKTAAGFSDLWDGRPFTIVRSNSSFQRVSGKRLSMHLMVQPQIARKLLANPVLEDQGFLSRMLIVQPEVEIGTRRYRKTGEQVHQKLSVFQNRIQEILQAPKPLKANAPNEIEPRALPLSTGALEMYIEFYDEVEEDQGPEGEYVSIRGFASKAPEMACRLAAALTLFQDLEAKEISPRRMKQGIDLMDFYLHEALRQIGAGTTDPDLELAQELLTWIQKRGSQFSLVEIYQKGPMRIRDAETARRIMEILVDHGWVRKIPNGLKVGGRKRREVYTLT